MPIPGDAPCLWGRCSHCCQHLLCTPGQKWAHLSSGHQASSPSSFSPCCFPPAPLEPGRALRVAGAASHGTCGCWCRAWGSLGWWGAAWSREERASAEPLRRLSPSSPSLPEPPPGGECSFKEDLEMSNGKHLTGEPLRRFCSSEWECEIRSDMKGCTAPSPKSRRRGGWGVCGCTRRSSRERLAPGSPLPPSLPFQQLN